jgi:diaminopimelate decarboxylase
LDVGAYGISMANNYNARGRPRMILTGEKGIFIIREKESYADLLSKDIVPDYLL